MSSATLPSPNCFDDVADDRIDNLNWFTIQMNQLNIQIIIEITTKRKQTNLIALLGCAAAGVVDDDVATETETAMRKKIDFHNRKKKL